MKNETALRRDDLDDKVNRVFAGKVVRKDLVRKVKVGANVPVFVLEYLLGKYCASSDEMAIQMGMQVVKDTLSDLPAVVQGALLTGSLELIELLQARAQALSDWQQTRAAMTEEDARGSVAEAGKLAAQPQEARAGPATRVAGGPRR